MLKQYHIIIKVLNDQTENVRGSVVLRVRGRLKIIARFDGPLSRVLKMCSQAVLDYIALEEKESQENQGIS